MLSSAAMGQILNSSFENARANGGPANWGRTILIPSPCNVAQGFDSVYFQTTDAHTGTYALEMRNAQCDASSFFSGGAFLMDVDSFYFGSGMPFTERPASISFFYKLFSTGGDYGHVSIQLVDELNGEGLIAQAELDIAQATGQYTLYTAPLEYYSNGTPNRLIINFTIENPLDHVHYGTRFLVDDVSALATDIKDIKAAKSALVVYPNPSHGPIAIRSAETGLVQLEVSNMLGQVVYTAKTPTNTAIELPTLSAGLYTYRVLSNNAILGSGKLIRE